MGNEELKTFFYQLYFEAYIPNEYIKDYPKENLCFGEARIGKVAFSKKILEENSVKLYQLFKKIASDQMNICFNDLKKVEFYCRTGHLWPFDDLLALGTATGFISFKKEKQKWNSEDALNPELVMDSVLFEDIDLSLIHGTTSRMSEESLLVSKIIDLYKKCVTEKEDNDVCYGQNRIKRVAFNKSILNQVYKTLYYILNQFNIDAQCFCFDDLKVLKNGFRMPLDVVEYLLAMAHASGFVQYENDESKRNPLLTFTADFRLCADLQKENLLKKKEAKKISAKERQLSFYIHSLYESALAKTNEEDICLGKNRYCSIFFNKNRLTKVSDEVLKILNWLSINKDSFSFEDLKVMGNRFKWLKEDESVIDQLFAMANALGILDFAETLKGENRDYNNPKLTLNPCSKEVQLNLIDKKVVEKTSSCQEKKPSLMDTFYKKFFILKNSMFSKVKKKEKVLNREEQFSNLVLSLYEKCLACSINEEICYGCNREETIAFNKGKLERFFPEICHLLNQLSIASNFTYNDLKMMRNHFWLIKDEAIIDCLLAMANGLGIIQFSKQFIECEEDSMNPELFISDAYFFENIRRKRLKIS